MMVCQDFQPLEDWIHLLNRLQKPGDGATMSRHSTRLQVLQANGSMLKMMFLDTWDRLTLDQVR